MAIVTKPMALDESIKTTESTSRNIADVLAQELSGIASAITGGDGKANKTDIATVEPTNTASRAYSVGELVYVNGNLYKVITAITIGATFTVGTNIQSTNVSGSVKDALDNIKCGQATITANPNAGTDMAVTFTNPYPVGTNYMVQLTQSGEYALANLFLGVTQRTVSGFTIQVGSSRSDTRAVDIAWLAVPMGS